MTATHTLSPTTLYALLDQARADEARCYRTLTLTEPNTPDHVKWHGHWQFHRGERRMLELLIGGQRHRNDMTTVMAGEEVRV